MANYNLTLLIKESIAEKDRKEILDGLTKSFGKVSKEDIWGSRSLSYPIQKQAKAFYAHYEFEADPAVIAGIDKTLKLNEDVIRYLILRND